MDRGEEVAGGLVVARGDSSELEPSGEILLPENPAHRSSSSAIMRSSGRAVGEASTTRLPMESRFSAVPRRR